MASLNVMVPDDILFTLREDDKEFSSNMKKFTALKLYEMKKLSLGQGADLAGMDKQDFIGYLSENQISIFSYMSKKDLERDMENA